MDAELKRMQEIADCLSHARLRRFEKTCRSSCDDSMLLLGLILILTIDGADMMLLLMLLYIFSDI